MGKKNRKALDPRLEVLREYKEHLIVERAGGNAGGRGNNNSGSTADTGSRVRVLDEAFDFFSTCTDELAEIVNALKENGEVLPDRYKTYIKYDDHCRAVGSKLNNSALRKLLYETYKRLGESASARGARLVDLAQMYSYFANRSENSGNRFMQTFCVKMAEICRGIASSSKADRNAGLIIKIMEGMVCYARKQ